MVEVLVFSAIVSIALSLILTPFVIKFAFLVGAIDKPDERKIHKRTMPRLGGLAPFISFVLTLVILHFVMPQAKFAGLAARSSWLIIAISISAILLLGVCDDVWSLKPGQKFLVQFIAGALVYAAGFKINSLTNPFTGGVLYFGMLSFPLTVLWVVGITNAFNLIDGLDGLAAGIAVIATVTVTAISLLHNDITTAVIAIALSGAVLGFLRYNFNPAKVFLGDSGSLFLGFTLAVLSIQSSTKGSTAFSVIVPLLALGVPIMDTSLAMLRRVIRSFMSDQSLRTSPLGKLHSMFLPDRRHIHHQLLAHGLSHKEAVLVLYVASCTFGLCAFLVTAGSLNSSLILIGVGVTAVIAVRKLGYREMALFRNGLLLRLYKKTFLRNVALHVALDVVSVFGAYLLADLLTPHFRQVSFDWRITAFSLVTVSAIQLLAFFVGGLYRRTIALLGLGDLLQILKAVFVGTILTALALWFLPFLQDKSNLGVFLLFDFYFLVTFIIGSRVAFHAMNYIFRREVTHGKKALIYGADANGMIALQTLLSGQSSEKGDGAIVTPVGFLDDNPKMEGKFLDGYPVFGGHWKLEGLMKKMDISEIVLASTNISPAAFSRVKKIADQHNVPVRISQMRFERVDWNVGLRNSQSKIGQTNGRALTPKTA
jgi:UDP-GlcNAc:undecaprenyl-phosphate/decaprenyl-phosphate GlcNAc-1-phosphate transferase